MFVPVRRLVRWLAGRPLQKSPIFTSYLTQIASPHSCSLSVTAAYWIAVLYGFVGDNLHGSCFLQQSINQHTLAFLCLLASVLLSLAQRYIRRESYQTCTAVLCCARAFISCFTPAFEASSLIKVYTPLVFWRHLLACACRTMQRTQ